MQFAHNGSNEGSIPFGLNKFITIQSSSLFIEIPMLSPYQSIGTKANNTKAFVCFCIGRGDGSSGSAAS